MNIRLYPTKLRGTVPAIASKSMAHRLLICAALADTETRLLCGSLSQDITATVQCLSALDADIRNTGEGFLVSPGMGRSSSGLYCGESGSTLRFLLPVAAALGHSCLFHLAGRLSARPLSPLEEELIAHGVSISRPRENQLLLTGVLRPGAYTLPGNVSSQFISGLLMALPLLNGASQLTVTGTMESAPYVDLTLEALGCFGAKVFRRDNVFILTPAAYHSPGTIQVEGDWSGAAFWFGANAMGSRVTVTGLAKNSLQGDRAIGTLLAALGHNRTVDVSQTPDLFPILAVAATAAEGSTHFMGGARLRLKESDRIRSVAKLLHALGGITEEVPHGLTVHSTSLKGGTVDSCADHRIAMAAAVAATCCREPVTILDSEVTAKSYPGFWKDYISLGGKIEEV